MCDVPPILPEEPVDCEDRANIDNPLCQPINKEISTFTILMISALVIIVLFLLIWFYIRYKKNCPKNIYVLPKNTPPTTYYQQNIPQTQLSPAIQISPAAGFSSSPILSSASYPSSQYSYQSTFPGPAPPRIIQPIQPVQSNQPVQFNQPVQSSQPMQSSQPIQSSQPMQSSQAVQFNQPVQSNQPTLLTPPTKSNQLNNKLQPSLVTYSTPQLLNFRSSPQVFSTGNNNPVPPNNNQVNNAIFQSTNKPPQSIIVPGSIASTTPQLAPIRSRPQSFNINSNAMPQNNIVPANNTTAQSFNSSNNTRTTLQNNNSNLPFALKSPITATGSVYTS